MFSFLSFAPEEPELMFDMNSRSQLTREIKKIATRRNYSSWPLLNKQFTFKPMKMETTIRDSHNIPYKPHIFVVEDNTDIGFILHYYLSEEGFEVKLFPTAAAFIDTFKVETPDIVLMDVMLPDGNGLELCERIKHDPRTADLPVLIMSAHASIANNMDCPAEEFIPKPFDLEFLLTKIKRHLPAA